MNPSLILFGIQSVVRLGRVGQDVLEQSARDGAAIFPDLQSAEFNTETFVNGFFNKPENQPLVIGEVAPFAEYWDGVGVRIDPTAIDAMYTAAIKIRSERGIDTKPWAAPQAALLIKQWDPASPDRPLSPWARIIFTAGDIALEFIAANPDILGGNGSGEKLLAAYAENLSQALPDNGDFGPAHNFGQRLLGAFLKAGLSTLSKNPQWVVSEEHVQKLISASVAPLIEAFPEDIVGQLRWNEVTEALVGPSAAAVLRTVADRPATFLGRDFRADEALGALTQALLKQAVESDPSDTFTRKGLLGLYQAALGVAAERPQLFLGNAADPEDFFARDLLSRFVGVLRDAPDTIDWDVGVELAKATLESVSAHINRFAVETDGWEKTAAEMAHLLTNKLGEALAANRRVGDVFSKPQLIELGRVLLSQVADSPGMILGSGNEAWNGVLTTVANAMKEDKNLLLGGRDWIEIARVAAEEAAANPARLFRLDADGLNAQRPDDVLAAKLIRIILKSSGEILAQPNLRRRNVLFGGTLREAIVIVLRATAGKPLAGGKQVEAIGELVQVLNRFVAENHASYGKREWLRLFRIFLSRVLDGRTVPTLTPETVNGLL